MIFVSQGHENGIGLEIFLKSFLSLGVREQRLFTLAVNKKTFEDHLVFLKLNKSQFKNLSFHFFSDIETTQSTDSLNWCLNNISAKDLLITLPTSKDQLILNGNNCSGYTEYFRAFYSNKNISMVFKSFKDNVLLITDHVPLSEVSKVIDSPLIESKISIALDGFNKYFFPIKELYIAGLNPHAGESGLLGKEEIKFKKSLETISKKYNLNNLDFLSGDTLHVYKKGTDQLFVYMYHDQGLARFKSENGFIGLNITFGLPFLRLSVDHGTAFNLYAKNSSNISGMIYLFKEAVEVHNNVNK